jgi:hypothetical protein
MPSSGMWRRVTLVRTDVLEERSPQTSVLTIATFRHVTEDGILHSHSRENLKPNAVTLYMYLHGQKRNICITSISRRNGNMKDSKFVKFLRDTS